ncbi:MAG: NAD(P)/FAD-dependent oxidoreductase [Candidatus Aenigmatarchaeota archaeon]
MKYDIIVVGAGSAGCMAALTAAKRNFDVCLIDAKPKNRIGDKICGNAVSYHHFEEAGFNILDEMKTNEIDGIIIYTPSLGYWKVPGGKYKGCMLNRYVFGQLLLDFATDAGAKLIDKTIVKKPIIEKNFVKGVEVFSSGKIYGDIVIDASGLRSKFRSELPSDFGIEEIKDKDVNCAYREIRKIKHKVENKNYCEIYLNPENFPGGYGWIFPHDENTVNVGLGVQKLPNHPNPKKRLYETLLKMELFEDSKILEINGVKQAGGMDVSTRRPLTSLVGNGFLIAGEAGSIVDPITGGGNGQAVVSGKLASEVACNALENNNPSKENLWLYNFELYTKSYGYKYLPLDALRILLQSLTSKDIDYIRNQEIIREEDLIALTTETELRLSILEKAVRTLKGIKRFDLMRNLNYVTRIMRKLQEICLEYPKNPEGFYEWKEEVDLIFSNLETKFKPHALWTSKSI